jgi:hypothetical protein
MTKNYEILFSEMKSIMWLFDIKFNVHKGEKKMNRFPIALAKGQDVGSLEHDGDLSGFSNESSKKKHLNERYTWCV